MRWVMRSKLHNGVVTEANLAYVGSITIDEDLLDAVGLWPGEKVLVVSNTSGARLETYTIAGARGSRAVCMNGAAAHLIGEGEQIRRAHLACRPRSRPPAGRLLPRRLHGPRRDRRYRLPQQGSCLRPRIQNSFTKTEVLLQGKAGTDFV